MQNLKKQNILSSNTLIRKFITISSIAIITLSQVSCLLEGEKVERNIADNLTEGLAMAGTSDKPLLIHFVSQWSEPSLYYTKNVITDKEYENVVGQSFVEYFIEVPQDVLTASKDVKDALVRYNVTSVPSIMIVDKDGNLIDRYLGTPDGVDDMLGFIARNSKSINAIRGEENAIKVTEKKILNSEGKYLNVEEGLDSAKPGQLVLLEFTGSDWCPPCQMMHKTVFSTKEFENYSKDLIHIYIDMPKRKKQTTEQKQYNMSQVREYNVQGYPTYIIFKDGKEVGRRVGAVSGGFEGFEDWIQRSQGENL